MRESPGHRDREVYRVVRYRSVWLRGRRSGTWKQGL